MSTTEEYMWVESYCMQLCIRLNLSTLLYWELYEDATASRLKGWLPLPLLQLLSYPASSPSRPPLSPSVLNKFSLWSFPLRHAMYLLQKSRQSSWTFSSSNKCILSTCKALSIYKNTTYCQVMLHSGVHCFGLPVHQLLHRQSSMSCFHLFHVE